MYSLRVTAPDGTTRTHPFPGTQVTIGRDASNTIVLEGTGVSAFHCMIEVHAGGVCTLKERGYDIVYYLWVGLFAPKGTPPAIVQALAAAIDKAGASAQFNAAMANIGLEPGYLSAADFSKFWDEDAKRSDDAVRQIGKV